MRYRVWHETAYTYDAPVTDSLGRAHLVPSDRPGQRVLAHRVEVRPEPGDLSHDVDHFGNATTYFQVTEPHRQLVIEATSEVEVVGPVLSEVAMGRAWSDLRPLARGPGSTSLDDAWWATEFAMASPLVVHESAAAEYAATSLREGRPIGEAAIDLSGRIHADFDYDQTATSVTSTVAEIMAQRAGVCQDFAHLTLACLRSHGLAARYVSGYLATEPAPGQARVVGADASHAWVEVWLGEDEWLPLDPTNDQVPGERYVAVACGRDYADVPPVKGVIFSEATRSTLRVSVDVAPLLP